MGSERPKFLSREHVLIHLGFQYSLTAGSRLGGGSSPGMLPAELSCLAVCSPRGPLRCPDSQSSYAKLRDMSSVVDTPEME